MSDEIVTKEDFEAYEDIKRTGVFNMMDREVRELIDVTKVQHIYIIENYEELKKKYAG